MKACGGKFSNIMVGDRFDDIGAAITNSKTNVTLDTVQSGDWRRKDKGPELEVILDNGDDEMEDYDLEDREISQLNDVITTHRSLGAYSIPIHLVSSPPATQTPDLTRRKSGVMWDLIVGLKE